MRTITVQPVDTGWTIKSPGLPTSMIFESGGAAEAEARRLAEHQSRQGEHVEIRFHLRDGGLGPRFICAPQAPPQIIWDPIVAAE